MWISVLLSNDNDNQVSILKNSRHCNVLHSIKIVVVGSPHLKQRLFYFRRNIYCTDSAAPAPEPRPKLALINRKFMEPKVERLTFSLDGINNNIKHSVVAVFQTKLIIYNGEICKHEMICKITSKDLSIFRNT